MKKLIILCAIVLTTLLLTSSVAGCQQPPASRPAPLPPWELSASPAQDVYPLGENVEIKLSFSNRVSEPITVSPFPPKIQIMLPKHYEVVRSFVPGTREIVLEPGERVTYNLTWDQRDDNEKQVSPGWYYVDVIDINVTKATPPERTGGDISTLTKIFIQYLQGAIEKTIEMNQSQTVNGVTITLERVELSKTEAKFYAFTIPPGYTLPQPLAPGVPSPPEAIAVHAEYVVDGMTKDAGWAVFVAKGEGIGLSWKNLDPVPSNAKELTFRITKLGDWEGPWEFKVPLE